MTEAPDLDFYDFLLEIRAGAPVCVKCGADLNIDGAKPGQYYRVKCDSVAHAWEPLTAEPPLRMADFRKEAPVPDETPTVSEGVLQPAEDGLDTARRDTEVERLRSLLEKAVLTQHGGEPGPRPSCPRDDDGCWWCREPEPPEGEWRHKTGCPWPELEAAVLSWWRR
jgi:hypothetical protein